MTCNHGRMHIRWMEEENRFTTLEEMNVFRYIRADESKPNLM